MLINCSNHNNDRWSPDQIQAAIQLYGAPIVYLPFPSIHHTEDTSIVVKKAEEFGDSIQQIPCPEGQDKVVLVMGEMCFTFNLVRVLKSRRIRVVHACSDRYNTTANRFVFARFRDY